MASKYAAAAVVPAIVAAANDGQSSTSRKGSGRQNVEMWRSELLAPQMWLVSLGATADEHTCSERHWSLLCVVLCRSWFRLAIGIGKRQRQRESVGTDVL